jgi:hypothetical protein
MPVLTRGAKERLDATRDEADAETDTGVGATLALRGSVAHKAKFVWACRANTDVYSRTARDDVVRPQVDHCLEVQLAEIALVRALIDEGAAGSSCSLQSFATRQAVDWLRTQLNGVDNLNVTSARHNLAKRGPVTAALRRARSESLRTVSLEQHARQGKARWLVDNGDWNRIETEMVRSYDVMSSALEGAELHATDMLPTAATLVRASVDEMGALLGAMHVV